MTLALGVRHAVVSIIVAAAVVTSCSSSSVAPSPTDTTPRTGTPSGRVLFIGNSLTEANGLPAMVETLSRQGEGTPISTASVVFDGFSLEDHWNQGTARRRIAEGGWSIVVLQQGPSSLPESQAASPRVDGSLRYRHSGEWRPDGTLHGVAGVESPRRIRCGEPVVCASRGRRQRHAASRWARPGAAHGAAIPKYRCTVRTGFIPTPTATYLAALVIYQQISGRSPVGLPALTQMPADRARLLQDAAQEANAQFGRR